MKRNVRRYIYGIATAALPLLVSYGIVAESSVTLWVALFGAALVPGLALFNTPKKDGEANDGIGTLANAGALPARTYRGKHAAVGPGIDLPARTEEGEHSTSDAGGRAGIGAPVEEAISDGSPDSTSGPISGDTADNTQSTRNRVSND